MTKVVARITRYSPPGQAFCRAISRDDPVWVIGEYFPDNINYDIYNEVVLIMSERVRQALINMAGPDPEVIEDYLKIALSTPDEWTLVPEDEWPDEVCAAVAEKTLLGEI